MRIQCEMKKCDEFIEYPNIVNETEDSWTDLAHFLTQNGWKILHQDEPPYQLFIYCFDHEMSEDETQTG